MCLLMFDVARSFWAIASKQSFLYSPFEASCRSQKAESTASASSCRRFKEREAETTGRSMQLVKVRVLTL